MLHYSQNGVDLFHFFHFILNSLVKMIPTLKSQISVSQTILVFSFRFCNKFNKSWFVEGFAKKCENRDSLMTQCGTPGYVAPEIVTGSHYDLKVDNWSLGVIMYIILCGYPPFNAKNQKSLFKLIKRGLYEFHDQHWSHISDEAKEFISKLLLVDPSKRLSATDALGTKWMNQNAATLRGVDLTSNLGELRKFNAKRKVKQAILAVSRQQCLLCVCDFVLFCVDSNLISFSYLKRILLQRK